MHIAFCQSGPELHPDFLASLMVYYRRIPEVCFSPYGMWLESDIDALLRCAADCAELKWICIVSVGVVFADQGRIGQLLGEAALAMGEETLAMGERGDNRLLIVNLAVFRRLQNPQIATRIALTEPLRAAMVYAGTHEQVEKLNHNLDLLFEMEDLHNPCQRAILGWLVNQRLGVQPDAIPDVGLIDQMGTIFLFNTEPLLCGTKAQIRPLDIYFGPCAGFLEVATLYTYGMHEGSKLIFYDINKKSIEIKKRIFNEFDGQLSGLAEYFSKLIAEYSHDLSFSLGNVKVEIGRILQIFGSEAEFANCWSKVRRLNVEFVQLNLITEHEILLAKMSESANGFIAISDIFTGQNELIYGSSAIHQCYNAFIKSCQRFPDLLISGTDADSKQILLRASNLAAAHD